MPPSTATHGGRRQVALDRLDRVERHARVRDERAAGLEHSRLPGPSSSSRRAHRGHPLARSSAAGRRRCRPRRGRRRGRRRRSRRAWRSPRPPRGTARGRSSCEPMWMCRPASSSRGRRARRSIASAPGQPKPNFESAWPVAIAAWVSATTPGVTRISTGCARPPGTSAPALEVVDVSSTTARRPRRPPSPARPRTSRCRAGRSARRRSRLQRERAARRPTRRRTPSPSSANTCRTAVHGNALEAKTTSPASCRAAIASSNSRARARRSSSATT